MKKIVYFVFSWFLPVFGLNIALLQGETQRQHRGRASSVALPRSAATLDFQDRPKALVTQEAFRPATIEPFASSKQKKILNPGQSQPSLHHAVAGDLFTTTRSQVNKPTPDRFHSSAGLLMTTPAQEKRLGQSVQKTVIAGAATQESRGQRRRRLKREKKEKLAQEQQNVADVPAQGAGGMNPMMMMGMMGMQGMGSMGQSLAPHATATPQPVLPPVTGQVDDGEKYFRTTYRPPVGQQRPSSASFEGGSGRRPTSGSDSGYGERIPVQEVVE